MELGEKYNSLFDGWFKNLTALSIGALTLLVSLMPSEVVTSPDKYFLVTCWVFLGASILFGLIGSFRLVIIAQLNLLMNIPPQKNTPSGAMNIPNSGLRKMRFVIFSQNVAIVSFFLAFISLTIYACLKTL
jgi:hypothetical protein